MHSHFQPLNHYEKGAEQRGVLRLQTWAIMAICWGSSTHDGNPQFAGSTDGTQFITMYSIQYGCGRH
jgi:hypothetical protein